MDDEEIQDELNRLHLEESVALLEIMHKVNRGTATEGEKRTLDNSPLGEFLNNPANHCIRCDHLCPKHHAFCIACGQPNSNFDEQALIVEIGYDLEGAKREECAQGHPETSPRAARRPDWCYCTICGLQFKDDELTP
jgi:hypothetical protein